MRHFASPAFWKACAALPESVQALADKSYELLKENPRHPSLQLKKVSRFWSARVGGRYRALAVEVEEGLLWFWIGSHADYDAMIQGLVPTPPDAFATVLAQGSSASGFLHNDYCSGNPLVGRAR